MLIAMLDNEELEGAPHVRQLPTSKENGMKRSTSARNAGPPAIATTANAKHTQHIDVGRDYTDTGQLIVREHTATAKATGGG
jgi:hypothetical protein